MSELAFDAEYGEFGLYGDASLKGSSSKPKLPKTSSVEMCKNVKSLGKSLPNCLIDCKRLNVPIIFVFMNAVGSEIDLST